MIQKELVTGLLSVPPSVSSLGLCTASASCLLRCWAIKKKHDI